MNSFTPLRCRLLAELEQGDRDTVVLARTFNVSTDHIRREMNDLRRLGVTRVTGRVKRFRNNTNLWGLSPRRPAL